MSSKFWAELSNDYEKLFETEIGYDVIIYAGEEQMLKKFVHIQIFCVLDLNIFVLHFLTNGPRKETENLFLGNRIFHHNYLILFLGNYNIYNKFQHFILKKYISNY